MSEPETRKSTSRKEVLLGGSGVVKDACREKQVEYGAEYGVCSSRRWHNRRRGVNDVGHMPQTPGHEICFDSTAANTIEIFVPRPALLQLTDLAG